MAAGCSICWRRKRFDPLEEAEQGAQDAEADLQERLRELRTKLEAASVERDRLLRLTAQLDDAESYARRVSRRQELIDQYNEVSTRHRQLLDERARLLGDVLPVGRSRTAPEIRASLQNGELFLEYTIAEGASFLYVVSGEADVEAIPLPNAFGCVQRVLPGLLRRISRNQLGESRGPQAGGGERRTRPTRTPHHSSSSRA